MRLITLDVAHFKQTTLHLSDKIEKHFKRVDVALSDKHTQQLYDQLSWREASILAQLRTDMVRLNEYLYCIEIVLSDQYVCRQARETVKHFLFWCRKWTAYWVKMLQCTDTCRSNIFFYLKDKTSSDDKNWKSDLNAVWVTIHFAIATGWLNAD